MHSKFPRQEFLNCLKILSEQPPYGFSAVLPHRFNLIVALGKVKKHAPTKAWENFLTPKLSYPTSILQT